MTQRRRSRKSKSASRRHPLFRYGQLEDRRALAVFADFLGGTLTVSLTDFGDAAFLRVNGNGGLDVGTVDGGSDIYSGNDAVTRVAIQDQGPAGGQSVTFGGSTPFFLIDGLASSGIEMVTFDQAVDSGSTGSAISVNAATEIMVNAPLTTAGGGVMLSATQGITLNDALASDGGNISLNADADGDGSGGLTLAAALMDSWFEQDKFTGADSTASDSFGYSVSLTSDGMTAVVGAPYAFSGGTPYQGAAYIFERTGTVWTQQAKLSSDDGAAFDQFGFSVAFSGDGSTVLVGSLYSDVGGNSDQGAAYVFTRVGAKWAQQAKLTHSDGQISDAFGWSVALDATGNTALIVRGEDDFADPSEQRAAYVFTRSGEIWSEEAKLTASDGFGYEWLGGPVALSGDGNTAVVGAPLAINGANYGQGAVYVFSRLGSFWFEESKLSVADGEYYDTFGSSVALSSDGSTLIVGAEYDDVGANRDQGSAYVFVRSGFGWTQEAQLTAADGAVSDYFGRSVALSADGSTAIVGAPSDMFAPVPDPGRVYSFVRSGTSWSAQSQFTAAGGGIGDSYGYSVALSADGRSMIAGVPDDQVGVNSYQGSVSGFYQVSNPGGSISAGGGMVSLKAVDIDLKGEVSGSSVTLDVAQANRPIDVGTKTAGALGLTAAELDLIATDTLVIGSSSSGNLTVSANLNRNTGGTLALLSGNEILVNGGSINTAGGGLYLIANQGIAVSTDIITSGGSVTLSADADGDGSGGLTVAAAVMAGWLNESKFTADDGAANDSFGWSIALSSDGNTAIVGANSDDIGTNPNQGSAYIFVRQGAVWSQQAILVADDGLANDNFGWSVALSSDGNTAIVGASGDDFGVNTDRGSAYIFVREGTTWSQQAKLVSADGAAGDYFGWSTALSDNGNTAVIGAYRDDVGTNPDQGSAYIFSRVGTTWSQVIRLVAVDGGTSDNFGYSVALSGDGTRALVGAPADDVGINGNQGSAYLFNRSQTVWSQEFKLTAADGGGGDNFGWSVALSDGGSTVLVGAPNDNIGAFSDQGSAYVFIRSAAVWSQQAKLTAGDGAAGNQFGNSVALSGDGSTAIIGAYLQDVGTKSSQGSAYLFTRVWTDWTQELKLTDPDGAAGDQFGWSVALSSDGSTAMVGANSDDLGTNQNQGSVSTFARILPKAGGSINAGSGTVSMTVADADLGGEISSSTSVTIGVEQTHRPIDLGTNTAGALGLTATELNRINTPSLQIGNTASGKLTVSANVARAASTDVTLMCDDDIVVSGGTLNTGGGSLLLVPGYTSSVKPNKSGDDFVASEVSFNSGRELSIRINGPAADSQYSRLKVAGAVNLDGIELVLSGSYTFTAGDLLTIVSGTSRSGNFNGLPDGATLTFGSQTLQINYTPTGATLKLLVINLAPTLDELDDLTIDEDALLQTINLTGITAGNGEVQPLRIKASSSNPGLIPNPTVVYLSPNSTGSLRFAPLLNLSGSATITVTVEDGGPDNNLATTADNATFTRTFVVTVTPVNDAPVIINLGGDITYRENTLIARLCNAVKVQDVDTPVFNNGTLRVAVESGGESADRLWLNNSKYMTVSGDQLVFAGVVVGTFSGGTAGQPLLVTFNQRASLNRVQHVLRCVCFAHDSENPQATPRTVSIQLTDGVGGQVTASKKVNVIPVNDRPTLSGLPTSSAYTLNSTPILIAPAAFVADPDNVNFAGGQLYIRYTAGSDASNRLLVGGLFSFDGANNLLRNGTIIGQRNLNGGEGQTGLLITFNSNATREIVQETLRSISFQTVAGNLRAARTLQISLTDGLGGGSNQVQTRIDVS